MSYQRVLPRDFFNESKLLKCLGRLTLLIHDCQAPKELKVEHNYEPFNIELAEDGHLYVSNVNFYYSDQELYFKTVYNSKENYPLYLEHDYVEYLVFDENGEFEEDFLNFLSNFEKYEYC